MMIKTWNLLALSLLLGGCGMTESGAGSVAAAGDGPKAEASDKAMLEGRADAKTKSRAERDGPGAEDAAATTARPGDGGDAKPLHVFYVIHGHQGGEHLPYADENMTRLDRGKAENFVDVIKQISDTTNRYGLPITWELVAGTAKGVKELQGQNNIFKELVGKGHEIGMHTHSASRIKSTIETVNQSLGMLISTGSGLQMDAIKAGPNGAQGAVSDGIAKMVASGINTASIGLVGGGRSPLGDVCRNKFGDGNDMTDKTGQLMFPYKPDYKNQNVCKHNPSSDFTFVDHTGPEWLLAGERKSELSDTNFKMLQKSLDASLAYMDQRKPDKVAVWGFTTHLSEYCQGNQGGPVIPSAIQALDDFVKYMDGLEKEGKIKFITVGGINDLL